MGKLNTNSILRYPLKQVLENEGKFFITVLTGLIQTPVRLDRQL
jgi:hypothetical protein